MIKEETYKFDENQEIQETTSEETEDENHKIQEIEDCDFSRKSTIRVTRRPGGHPCIKVYKCNVFL